MKAKVFHSFVSALDEDGEELELAGTRQSQKQGSPMMGMAPKDFKEESMFFHRYRSLSKFASHHALAVGVLFRLRVKTA